MATYKGDKVKTCYASCSIGHKPSHNLPAKLEAIAHAGFKAIELSMPDIQAYGGELNNVKEIDDKDYDALVDTGKEIKKLTDKLNLKILMLQPFANFEGWPKGSKEREDAFNRAKGWIRIMEAVGTDMLQIGSSDSPGITSNTTDLANDLAEVADHLAEKNFRIAYENWCWATHAPNWLDVWNIIQAANRPNIGLCLDTFQSAGGEYADPTTRSGLREDKSRSRLEDDWKASLKHLTTVVPPERIYIFQISDAYRMDPPIEDQVDDDGLRPRGQWSHDYRPLPYDGGYLPIESFTRAVMETGFRGWLSMEVFDGRGPEKYPDDMRPYATQAMGALERLLKESEGERAE